MELNLCMSSSMLFEDLSYSSSTFSPSSVISYSFLAFSGFAELSTCLMYPFASSHSSAGYMAAGPGRQNQLEAVHWFLRNELEYKRLQYSFRYDIYGKRPTLAVAAAHSSTYFSSSVLWELLASSSSFILLSMYFISSSSSSL